MSDVYTPEVWLELPQSLQLMQMHAFSMGYNGNLYILASTETVNRRLVNFPRTVLESPIDYTLFEINDWHVETYDIPDQKQIFSYVQPLPDDEFLLVNARSQYRGRDDFDRNALVVSSDGQKKRQFLVGDGIESVCTSSKGEIWTSYFDEGVIGNFGWGNHPIGSPGLIQWDKWGQQQFAYYPISGLKLILDCYAMTIDAYDQIWIYYRPDFPLVQIINGIIRSYWDIPVKGALYFTIWRDYALFLGDYNNRKWLNLYQLLGNQATFIKRLELSFDYENVCTWDDTLILSNKHLLYRIKIADLI